MNMQISQDEIKALDPNTQSKVNHLSSALSAAIPIWILKMNDWAFEERRKAAERCSTLLAGPGGEYLLFRGPKNETALAFNALAQGAAILAFCPGGVECFGHRYDASKFLQQIEKSLTIGFSEPMLEGPFRDLAATLINRKFKASD